jgi:hypothetical protein
LPIDCEPVRPRAPAEPAPKGAVEVLTTHRADAPMRRSA